MHFHSVVLALMGAVSLARSLVVQPLVIPDDLAAGHHYGLGLVPKPQGVPGAQKRAVPFPPGLLGIPEQVTTSLVIIDKYPAVSVSTVYSTREVTVLSCGPDVTNCPLSGTVSILTSVVPKSTTICPLTLTSTTTTAITGPVPSPPAESRPSSGATAPVTSPVASPESSDSASSYVSISSTVFSTLTRSWTSTVTISDTTSAPSSPATGQYSQGLATSGPAGVPSQASGAESSAPAPSGPAPSGPASSGPAPSQPAPSQPASSGPTASEPVPSSTGSAPAALSSNDSSPQTPSGGTSGSSTKSGDSTSRVARTSTVYSTTYVTEAGSTYPVTTLIPQTGFESNATAIPSSASNTTVSNTAVPISSPAGKSPPSSTLSADYGSPPSGNGSSGAAYPSGNGTLSSPAQSSVPLPPYTAGGTVLQEPGNKFMMAFIVGVSAAVLLV